MCLVPARDSGLVASPSSLAWDERPKREQHMTSENENSLRHLHKYHVLQKYLNLHFRNVNILCLNITDVYLFEKIVQISFIDPYRAPVSRILRQFAGACKAEKSACFLTFLHLTESQTRQRGARKLLLPVGSGYLPWQMIKENDLSPIVNNNLRRLNCDILNGTETPKNGNTIHEKLLQATANG